MTDPPAPPAPLDTGTPHSARIWNYWMHGTDHFDPDRTAGEQLRALAPDLVTSARAEREFLNRAVRHLAGDAGIRQFLDIGPGLPTADNTHQVAHRVAADTRVVYIDNDPTVLADARALLADDPAGTTTYLDADLRQPQTVLDAAAQTLDFHRPIAVMLIGVLTFIVDDGEARAVVRRLVDELAPGSYLVMSHPTTEIHGPAMTDAVRLWNSTGGAPMRLRDRSGVASFFAGLDVPEPGIVSCPRWRPDPTGTGISTDVSHFGGIGRKPRPRTG